MESTEIDIKPNNLDIKQRAYATGKRKNSIARVWLKRGSGSISVNGKSLDKYFARPVLQMIVNQPLNIMEGESGFEIMATVKGGGLSVINLDPDDTVEITDTEGKQKCEIIVFNKDGKPDCSLLGLKEKNDPKNIKKILSDKNESAFQAASALKKRNLDVGKAKASILFGDDSDAGEKVNLVSKDKCTCVFSAPGNAMKIEEQNPPTDLLLMIERSKPNKYKDKPNIPEPLVDPINEILIKHSTAIEYQVKKGDYIQIINPFGRQCSDFLAFDTAKLE